MEVQGFWPRQWEPLVAQFRTHFAEHGEEGAALAVMLNGEVVASLWAGSRDRQQQLPWQEDTRVNVFSAGKPLVAAACLQLVDSGALDLHRPIGDYWPEFASRGKEAVTAAQVLSHTSGLSAFHPRVKDPVIFDRKAVVSLLEYETPWWEPGSHQGYSPFLYGWILAELVRRVADSETFSDYFQQALAEPLGLDCRFGLPPSSHHHLASVAPLKRPLGRTGSTTPGASSAELGQLMKQEPRGVINRAFTNPMTLMNATNDKLWREAEIPAANCHASALGLARFYGALVSDHSPITGTTLAEGLDEQSAGDDKVLGVKLRFGYGFMLSQPVDDCRFGSAAGFGHPGAGGSLGFADPQAGIGFGYVTARLGQSLLIDPRAQALIHALYHCL